MTWYIKLRLDWRGLISMNNQRYDFSEVFSFLKSKFFQVLNEETCQGNHERFGELCSTRML